MHILGFISGMPGHMEILLIVFIITLLFGAKNCPNSPVRLVRALANLRRGRRKALGRYNNFISLTERMSYDRLW